MLDALEKLCREAVEAEMPLEYVCRLHAELLGAWMVGCLVVNRLDIDSYGDGRAFCVQV